MIKKCFLLFLITLVLVSCDNTEYTEASKSDNYLYNIYDSVLYKYSIKTGYGIPVCPDPVCKHNSDSCAFWGLTSNVMYYDNAKYFTDDKTIYKYNSYTGQLDSIYKSETGTLYYPYIASDYMFFNVINYKVDNDEVNTQIDIYRISLVDYSVLKLNKTPLYSFYMVEKYEKNTLYWYGIESFETFTTDISFENRQAYSGIDYGQHSGEYSYRFTIYSSSPMALTMIGKSSEQDYEFIVAENVVSAKALENNIIVVFNSAEPKFIGKYIKEDGSEGEIYDYQDNSIYIVNRDGSNKKLLCTIPETHRLYNLANSGANLISYPYIGIQVQNYIVDDNGYVLGKELSRDIVIVNVETGEYKITSSK